MWKQKVADDGVAVLAREWNDLLGRHSEEVVSHGTEHHPAVAAGMAGGAEQHELGALVAAAFHDAGGKTWWKIHWENGEGSSLVQTADIHAVIKRTGISSIEPSSWKEVAERNHQRAMGL